MFCSNKYFSNNQTYWIYTLFSSLCAFIGSMFFEHILLYTPCILCLIERYTFLTTSLISLSILKYSQNYLQHLFHITVFFAIGFFIYHILIEFHFIGDQFCTAIKLPDYINIDNFENFLKNDLAPTTSCAKKSPLFLNIPLTFWGLILYSTYLIKFIYCLINKKPSLQNSK